MSQQSGMTRRNTWGLAKAVAVTIAALMGWQSTAFAQCPQVHAMYRDLETWVHTPGPGVHYVEAQVTLVNPAAPNGSHFYTAWSKGCLVQGVANYGQCYLTSNPTLGLVFSDRKAGAPTMQPFTANKYDNHLVALDIVQNRLISKSITWSYEKVYTNLTRSGNVVYGVAGDGSMIVLSMLKKQTSGLTDPMVCGW